MDMLISRLDAIQIVYKLSDTSENITKIKLEKYMYMK